MDETTDGEFVRITNIRRFRELLSRSSDEEQRRQIFKLLAEEEAKQPLIGRRASE